MSIIGNNYNSPVNYDNEFDIDFGSELNLIMNSPEIKRCYQHYNEHTDEERKIFSDLNKSCTDILGTTVPHKIVLSVNHKSVQAYKKSILFPQAFKKILEEEFGSENISLVAVPETKPKGKATFNIPEELASDVENKDAVVINPDRTFEYYRKDEFNVDYWTPEQLIAINDASRRAFSAIDQLYKEQQRRLEEQSKNDEKSLLSNRNISEFKHDHSSAKTGNLTSQVYLKLQSEIKRRIAQELLATEQASQSRRKRERKRDEKDRKYDDLQRDIQVNEQKTSDLKQENIKIEKGIKKSEKSPQKNRINLSKS